MAPYVNSMDVQSVYNIAVSEGQNFNGRVVVMDENGVVFADSHCQLNGRVLRHEEVDKVRTGEANSAWGFHRVDAQAPSGFLSMIDKEWAVYYTASIVYQSHTVGIVLVSVSIQDIEDTIGRTMLQFFGISMLILGLLIVASILISRWISKPLADMTNVIQEMSRGNFDVRAKETVSYTHLDVYKRQGMCWYTSFCGKNGSSIISNGSGTTARTCRNILRHKREKA